ncbi:MAG TPA: cytochrome c biogenesis protein ResB [Dehalococcoidia bacterium]|nr:cytochrome c biogenesis protein ResB [Dehalococcoidia bacterium]
MATSARVTTASRGPSFDLLQPIWRLLTSVRFAVFFIGTLAIFGLLGVLIPQVPEAMRGNDAAIAAWVSHERGTFGPLTTPMYRFGLFEVFHARWFLFALGFLVVNVSVCTFNRWSPTFRNVFRPPVRVPDSFYERAHNRVALPPVSATTLDAALRRMRFRTRTEVRDGATHVFADRYPWAQLATFISHMALILFIAGGIITWATGFTSNIFAGTGTIQPVFAVSNPNQLQVRIDDAIGRFGPKGNALDFRTHLTIFKNGQQVASGTTTVNSPFTYGGYRFHQVAFFPNGARLQVRDLSTGNTVYDETFPLADTIAAPVVTISDATGHVLFDGQVAPTDFLDTASGSLVAIPGTSRVVWVGLTTRNDKTWQAVVFDPAAAGATGQARIDMDQTGVVSGLRVKFDSVASLPSANGIVTPASSVPLLAQLARAQDGASALLLTGKGLPAMALEAGKPVVDGGYQYTFVGPRTFAGIAVKKDDGAWFIWAATAMLLLGLAITFYVPRRRLWIRLSDSNTHVAALAEKSGGFEKDMRTLARRLGVAAPPELEEERE